MLGEVAGVFIAVVNLYGILMSLKHYERSMLHAAVSAKYSAVISENAAFGETALNDVRRDAHDLHDAHRSHYWTVKLGAYSVWVGLHILLLLIGVLVAVQNPVSTP